MIGDDQPSMTCPRCHREEPDFDGFGMLAHTKPAYEHGCGYCSHPTRDGSGTCEICGDAKRSTFRLLILSLTHLDKVERQVEFSDESDAREAFALHCEQARSSGGNLRLVRGTETLASYMAPGVSK